MRKVTNIVATLVAILSVGAVVTAAYASSGETSLTTRMLGATAMNQQTCKFLHRESDPATGPSWKDLRTYVIYEDARHDAKMACLARMMRNGKPGPRGLRGVPGPAGPAGPAGAAGGVAGYTQVSASGTGKTVTATCPSGDVVLGGGSPDEVTGSYPSSASSWSVNRDHLSPKTMTVTAVCAAKAVS